MKVPFGKYQGKELEKVALDDYFYFFWLRETIKKGELKVRVPQNFAREVEEIYQKLNHLPIKEKCKAPGCNNNAKYMSIILHYGGLNKIIDLALSDRFVFCSKECFKKGNGFMHERAQLYKIRFNVIKEIQTQGYIPKYLYKNLVKFLLHLCGVKRKTKKNIENLLEKAVLPQEQLSLF